MASKRNNYFLVRRSFDYEAYYDAEAKRYSKENAIKLLMKLNSVVNDSNEFKVARIENDFVELVPQPEVDATIEFLKLKMI